MRPLCKFRRTCWFSNEVSVLALFFPVARATGSLAGGFLVAVAGLALVLWLFCVSVLRLQILWSSLCRFTFSPAQWASP